MACFSGSAQTTSTSPMLSACSAVILSAATKISRARALPINLGSLCVPPHPVTRPSAAPRCPKIAHWVRRSDGGRLAPGLILRPCSALRRRRTPGQGSARFHSSMSALFWKTRRLRDRTGVKSHSSPHPRRKSLNFRQRSMADLCLSVRGPSRSMPACTSELTGSCRRQRSSAAGVHR